MFRVVASDGTIFVGRIHGSGGEISGWRALDRIGAEQRKASSGRALSIYEPAPGCVAMYIGDSWDAPQTVVSLIGSTIEVAS